MERIKGRALKEGRADDASEDVINNRIVTYHNQTEPLIEYYQKSEKQGYYDFDSKLWVDGDGMVITNDFLWCYLPVKQMKLFIQNMCNDVTRVGDYDDIGESLYFAITRDRKLFDMVSQTVRVAAEILDVE